jgi:hypothetical protein
MLPSNPSEQLDGATASEVRLMLTIRSMADMGLWTLTQIEVLDGLGEHCLRCGERIRYVWVMELRANGPRRVGQGRRR